MLDWLLAPLDFEFMRHAITIAVILGVLCAVVGSYLIVQRMGLLGEVVAHAVLPGLSIAYFLNINILVGAFTFGILSTVLINWIQAQSRIKADVAMAIVFSSFLALGIALITLLESRIDLHGFLFGDILSVTMADVWRTLAIAVLVLVLVALFYKELLFYTFDPLAAQAMGLPVSWIQFGLTAAMTLTIIASMQAVGVILVIALLIAPGATAYLLVTELHWMMILGAIVGILASISGMYISFYYNIPSGPAIVLVISVLFLLALLFSPTQGILTKPGTLARLGKLLQGRFLRLK